RGGGGAGAGHGGGAGFARDGRSGEASSTEEERALAATGGARRRGALERSGLCPRRAERAGAEHWRGAGFARDGRSAQARSIGEERALPATGGARRRGALE